VPAKNPDLHGNVPDEASTVLLLIDVINDLEFDGGAALLTQALPMAERLAVLKGRARAAGIPAVYVNDNFGRWRSDLGVLLAHCRRDGVRGRPLVERLVPEPDD
jgi:nicotinamidase-related amidase